MSSRRNDSTIFSCRFHAAMLCRLSRWGALAVLLCAEAVPSQANQLPMAVAEEFSTGTVLAVGAERLAFVRVDVPDDVLSSGPMTKGFRGSFLMSATEVPNRFFAAVTGQAAGNPALADLPVTKISFEEAQALAGRLARMSGRNVRLPNRWQWETAVTLGGELESSSTALARSWFLENTPVTSPRRPQPVGLRQPNPLGLYDLLGNVAEWCRLDPEEDPITMDGIPLLPLRGSSFISPVIMASELRLMRDARGAKSRGFITGIRLVIEDRTTTTTVAADGDSATSGGTHSAP